MVNICKEFMYLKIYTLPGLSRRFQVAVYVQLGTLSKDDNGSENVGKKMNLHSFKLNRVDWDPLNMSNAGDFS